MKVKKVYLKKILEETKENNRLLEQILAKLNGMQNNTPNNVQENIEISKQDVIEYNPSDAKDEAGWKDALADLATGFTADEFKHKKVDILIDTSGSADLDLIKKFLAGCLETMKGCEIRVGCFDTKFYGYQSLYTMNGINLLNYEGFGGTDFNAALKAFDSNVLNQIIFTDGWAHIPETVHKPYWIISNTDKFEAKTGAVLHIPAEVIKNDLRPIVMDGYINENGVPVTKVEQVTFQKK